MAKRAGAYRSEKRKKELSRQKKQEEKRHRRLNKGVAQDEPGKEGEGNGDVEQDKTEQQQTEQQAEQQQ